MLELHPSDINESEHREHTHKETPCFITALCQWHHTAPYKVMDERLFGCRKRLRWVHRQVRIISHGGKALLWSAASRNPPHLHPRLHAQLHPDCTTLHHTAPRTPGHTRRTQNRGLGRHRGRYSSSLDTPGYLHIIMAPLCIPACGSAFPPPDQQGCHSGGSPQAPPSSADHPRWGPERRLRISSLTETLSKHNILKGTPFKHKRRKTTLAFLCGNWKVMGKNMLGKERMQSRCLGLFIMFVLKSILLHESCRREDWTPVD